MNKLVKFWDKIIVVLLGVVGLSNIIYSCATKYGEPYAEYEIKGVITDKKASKPIQNIQVTRQIYQEYGDTIYTDANGKYAFYDINRSDFNIKFEDIDGEENGGEFETKEMDIKFTEADRVEKGDGDWYKGKFAKTVNIELEHKK